MNNDERDISFDYMKAEERLVVTITGNMRLTQRKKFNQYLNKVIYPIKECIVDLRATIDLDSAAIGMLLILKNHEQIKNSKFLVKVKEGRTVDILLKNSNLHQIIKIHRD